MGAALSTASTSNITDTQASDFERTPERERESERDQDGDLSTEMTTSQSFSAPVATQVTWAHDGHVVFVTGAWDNWSTKTQLTRSGPGDPFVAILSMPIGLHQYKYIVDGNWMHNPMVPTQTDQHGNLNNVVEVRPRPLEFDDDDMEDGNSLTHPDSFDYSVMPSEDLRSGGEPPELPMFLQVKPTMEEQLPAPTAYVRVDHFFSSGLAYQHASSHLLPPQEPYRTVAHTKRYKSKMITTVLVCK